MKKTILAACLSVLATGCGLWGQAVRGNDDSGFARAVAETAAAAAVARPGARVCRELQVGIAERDWVQGVVIEASEKAVIVRIENSGRFEHELGGTRLARGTLIRINAAEWIPCAGDPGTMRTR